MTASQSLYINNEWRQGSAPAIETFNQATGERLWSGSSGGKADVAECALAARQAFDYWAAMPVEDRLVYLRTFASVLKKKLSLLSEVISKEIGKPLWESRAEVLSMIAKVEISIEAQAERCRIVSKPHPLGNSVTTHRPLGVVAVFGPFNFPGHLPNGHIIPALLAGNTVIFKPSEYSPLVAEETMRCWEKTSLPPGVINMIQGGRETGKHLAEHPDIDGLFFTGSSSTGKKLSELFASRPEKMISLEMGGNNPLIVGSISDIEAAVYTIIQSAYLTSGQRCTCARRLIVVEEIFPHLAKVLISNINRIKVGFYTEKPEPYMGPVISPKTAEGLLKKQTTLIENGANPLVEMRSLRHGTGLLSPGLLDTTTCQNLPDEEIFGPLLKVIKVKDLKEGILKANDTAYGLSAGILSDNEEEYRLFKKNIKAGIINWNAPLTGASSSAPFGGVGLSGNHRPSGYYAADYCSYPVASIEASMLKIPSNVTPGLS